MFPIEYILILIVLACVIALIYISKKRKDLEKEISSSTNPSASTVVKEDIAPNPSQKTIYEFSSKKQKRLCPFCDGENDLGTNFCVICGRNI